MISPWVFSIFLLVNVNQSQRPDPLTITKEGQTISEVNRTDFTIAIPDLPLFELEKYNEFLDQLEQQTFTAPQNAMIDPHGNIQSEQIGFRINRKAFLKHFYSYFFSKGPMKVELPLLPIYPKVDSELLESIRINRIGRYVTTFNIYNVNRSHNIRLAVKAINNYVVFPGETFSFNKVVGKRTVSKGYERAPIIIKGETSEDIGGGICQVSTTLYNAVDNAGLQVIQRFSHSKQVPYIPPGRDATVSWDGPDFVFKNKYNQPILIQAKTLGNKLIIKIYSSENIHYTPKVVPYLNEEVRN